MRWGRERVVREDTAGKRAGWEADRGSRMAGDGQLGRLRAGYSEYQLGGP